MRRWKLTHPEFGRRSAIAREESAALYRELALEKAMECSEIADKIIKGTFVNASGQHVSEVPRGVAELAKLYIQEMNREAALRDDRRFGDRQRVALSGDRDAAPVQVQAIAPMTPEELKAIQDLEIAERENRFARGEL